MAELPPPPKSRAPPAAEAEALCRGLATLMDAAGALLTCGGNEGVPELLGGAGRKPGAEPVADMCAPGVVQAGGGGGAKKAKTG